MKIFKKQKYIAIFLLKESESYEVLEIRKLKPNNLLDKLTIQYKDIDLLFLISKPSYRNKNIKYYFMDIINKTQLFFEQQDNTHLTTLISKTENDKVIEQILSNIDSNPFKVSIYNMLLGIIIGVCGCGFGMSFFIK